MSKRTILRGAYLLLLLAMCFTLFACSDSSTNTSVPKYSEEKARQILDADGFEIDHAETLSSTEGSFSSRFALKPKKYENVTITSYLTFQANYQYVDETWRTDYSSVENQYDWSALEGRWYAKVESHDVYLDVKSFNENETEVTLEAKYKTTTGETGSYGQQPQSVRVHWNSRCDKMNNPVLYFYLSGGYPCFTVMVTRDTFTIWGGWNEANSFNGVALNKI